MTYIRFNSQKFGSYGGLSRYFGDDDDKRESGEGFKKGQTKPRPGNIARMLPGRGQGRGKPSPYGTRYEQHETSAPFTLPGTSNVLKTTIDKTPASTNILMPAPEVLQLPGLTKANSEPSESQTPGPSSEAASAPAPISPETAQQASQQPSQIDPQTGQIIRPMPMVAVMPGMMMPPAQMMRQGMPAPVMTPRSGPIFSPEIKNVLTKVGTALAAGLILL